MQGASLARKSVQYSISQNQGVAAEEDLVYNSKDQLEKVIIKVRKSMEDAAKSLDFIEAAALRDKLLALESKRKEFG
jgi:excinuclease ABC subunit B